MKNLIKSLIYKFLNSDIVDAILGIILMMHLGIYACSFPDLLYISPLTITMHIVAILTIAGVLYQSYLFKKHQEDI